MSERFGKYKIVKKLATGGMAEVFLARAEGPMGFEKAVVLKRILPALAEDQAFVDMFLAEARLAAGLNHPNVAHVYDFGEVDGRWFLAMEYVDGPTLRQVKKRAHDLGLPLPLGVVVRIIAQACEGLHYVHEARADGKPLGLVHRDISPDNLILAKSGAVKVLDFGIVKATTSGEGHTGTGTVRGKLRYMAPEQLAAEPLDRRVDVWALGVVLYELLTGARPYVPTQDAAVVKAILMDPFVPARERRPDLPAGLEAILTRCFEKDRRDRYATCRELQAALEQLLRNEGLSVGAAEVESLIVSLAEGKPFADPLATPSAPRAATRTRAVARPGVLPLALGLGALALLGGGASVAVLSRLDTPAPTPVPVAAVRPAIPRAVADAGLEEADAGEPLLEPDAGLSPEPEPELKPPPLRAGGTLARRSARVRVEFRVLPEGDALVAGEVVRALVVPAGKLAVRFRSPRFGETNRTVLVPPCEGVVRVGYTFTSEKLSSSCLP